MSLRVVSTYPPVVGPGFRGSYAFAAEGDYSGPTAGQTFFSFQWAPTTSGICVIQRIDLKLMLLAATTLHNSLGFFVARSFTAPATGGVALTPSRKRGSYPTSLVSDARYAQSGNLTSGTRVLDASPFYLQSMKIAASNAGVADPGLNPFEGPSHDDPIVLVSGEGIELVTVSGGTGNCRWLLRMEWAEMERGAF